MYARKRKFNQKSSYTISLDQKCNDKESFTLGKLKAKNKGVYTLYDGGQNPNKLTSYSIAKLRAEHGLYFFRYEPC